MLRGHPDVRLLDFLHHLRQIKYTFKLQIMEMTDVSVAMKRGLLSFCFDESQKAILSCQEECVHNTQQTQFAFAFCRAGHFKKLGK